MSDLLLEVENVTCRYGAFRALFGLSFQVKRGEIVALIGSNGAGKTTTLRAISGVLPLEHGRVSFAGRNINGAKAHAIVELGISHVPEGRQLFPAMTVEENLKLGAHVRRMRGRVLDSKIEEQYQTFPRLKERRRQLAGTLSGGEQQMVAIARGLMAEPRLLLLDEPSLGLAPRIVEEVFERIAGIVRRGITCVLVEQDVMDALTICDRAYVLENGAFTLSGTGRALLEDPRVRSAYLGL